MQEYMNLIFIALMFIVLYFFMIRPQMRMRKKQAEFMNSLSKGDKIVMASGIHGKIVEINEGLMQVAIDPKTVVTVGKEFVSMEATMRLSGSDDKAKA